MLVGAEWVRIEPYRTGSPWVGLPAEFGSWKRSCSRLRNWVIGGAWERVFTGLLAQAHADEDLGWVVPVGPRFADPRLRRADAG